MLKEPLSFISKDNKELEELIKRQTNEITKTEVRSNNRFNCPADIHHMSRIGYLSVINVAEDSN